MPSLEESIHEIAQAAGFPLVGIAPATEADGFDRLQEWLARGYSGEMAYMDRQGSARRHPDSILNSVRTIIMVAMEYAESGQEDKGTRGQGDKAEPIVGRISRYAHGPDYHEVIWERMGKVVKWLSNER